MKLNSLKIGLCILGVSTVTCKVANENGRTSLDTPLFPVTHSNPSVSADGLKVFYQRTKVTDIDHLGFFNVEDDSTGIWMVNIDGSKPVMLLQGTNLKSLSISPDGNWLLFNAGSDIFKAPFDGVKLDTNNIIQLTDDGSNLFPEWSPDGQQIVFSRINCGTIGTTLTDTCGLFLMNADGSEKEKIGNGAEPSWEPGGNTIIYLGLYTEVFRTNLEGNSLRLTSFNQDDKYNRVNKSPKTSPDGSKILFDSHMVNEKGFSGMWVMNSDGSDPYPLTHSYGTSGVWTPNNQIVYIHGGLPGEEMFESFGTIWIMNIDGTGNRRLTYNTGLNYIGFEEQ